MKEVIDIGSRVRYVAHGPYSRVYEVVRAFLNFTDVGHMWFNIRRVPRSSRRCVREYCVRDTDLELVND